MRFTLAFLVLIGFCSAALAAPQPELLPHWKNHAPDSEKSIDHSAVTGFLQKYVVADPKLKLNRVRYGAVSAADKKGLKTYIKQLEDTKITQYNRGEQRAYWINLYNAVTLDVVMDNYPVESIRKIGGSLFSGGPWDEKLITVEGKSLTLNEIEHEILRPIWPDPLNHYGVNCASIGCPNLRKEAYTSKNLMQALRANAKDYVNSPRGAKFNGDALEVSKIYDWFAVDFGGSEQAVISHLRKYAEPKLSAQLDAADGVSDYFYDWSLNDAK